MVVEYEGLTFVTVRGAGHGVPLTSLVSRFLSSAVTCPASIFQPADDGYTAIAYISDNIFCATPTYVKDLRMCNVVYIYNKTCCQWLYEIV